MGAPQPQGPLSTSSQFTENRTASGSRSGVSSSLLGNCYLPFIAVLHCWLLSGNLVGPLEETLLACPLGGGGLVSGSVVYGRQVKWSCYPDCFVSAMFLLHQPWDLAPSSTLSSCYIDGLMEPSPHSRFK